MKISVKARASATVANQPGYDLGGMPVRVLRLIAGQTEDWESLYDEVELSLSQTDHKPKFTLTNIISEEGADDLPISYEQHTAGKVVLSFLNELKKRGIDWKWNMDMKVKKGLSIKGTGLGSSGASCAASLRAFEEALCILDLDYKLNSSIKAKFLKEADFGVPDNSIPAYFGGLTIIDGYNVDRVEKHPDFGHFVLVTPKGFGLKTEMMRAVLEGKTAPEENAQLHQDMIEAIESGDTEKYGQLMEQAHQWFVGPRSKLYPGGGELYDRVYLAAKKNGATGVTISGAGPTILAVVPDLEIADQLGRSIYDAFAEYGYQSVVRLVDIDERGAIISS